jgi:hypothetical protein
MGVPSSKHRNRYGIRPSASETWCGVVFGGSIRCSLRGGSQAFYDGPVTDDEQAQLPLPKKITLVSQPFAGFALDSTAGGGTVRVLYRCGITADDPRFYLYVNQLSGDFLARANIDGDSITKFLILQHQDGTADIYTDYAAVVRGKVSREVRSGEPVFVKDISSIERYEAAGATIQPTDAVICVMKAGWKYALYFDASRNITQEHVWRELGELYRTLHVDRVISNIQERVKNQQRPHIITEGKTDWRHIEAARQALGIDIVLGYPSSDDSLGDAALLQVCERLSRFGPPNTHKVIAIFDRDNPQILSKLAARGNLDGFQVWGNNVYSFALPVPAHRVGYKKISIEMLYTDADIATTTSDGKRLYFDNELKTEVLPGAPVRHVPIPAVATKELEKLVFEGRADRIVTHEGTPVGLSKATFAELVYTRSAQFGSLDKSNFAPVFEVIKNIMEFEPPNVKPVAEPPVAPP